MILLDNSNRSMMEHDSQADETGLEIAAAACFDVKQGANIMHKFAEMQNHKKAGKP